MFFPEAPSQRYLLVMTFTSPKGCLMQPQTKASTKAQTFTLATFAGLAMSFTACLQNPSEVIDDTDYSQTAVTAQTAGTSLTKSFNGTKDWDQAIGNPADAGVMQAVFGASASLNQKASLAKVAAQATGKSGLLKSSATQAEEMKIDIDSAAGVVYLTHTTTSLGLTIENKAEAKWDDKAKDTVKDNENLIRFSQTKTYLLGKVENASFVDGDGDGIINVVSPGSKVKIAFEKKELGITETAQIVVGCGPDLDFDTEDDNTIHQATWNRKKGSTLMAEAAFTDGDNDGIIVDNADTSVVVLQLSEFNPLDRPLVQEVHAKAKVRLFGKKNGQDLGDEPMSFGYTETLKSGRVNTVSLKNRQGGEDFIKNDTMTVRLETVAKRDDDTLRTSAIEIVMNPGSDLKSDADDSAYSFHIFTQKKIGFEREAEFHFWAAAPVVHGQEPKAGRFEGEATYANGKTASLKGSFSPTGFQAEFTGPEGNTLAVSYSLSGEVIP
jgi:hypothetical protein